MPANDVNHIGTGQEFLNKSLRDCHASILTCYANRALQMSERGGDKQSVPCNQADVKKPACTGLFIKIQRIDAAIYFAGVFLAGFLLFFGFAVALFMVKLSS